MGYDEQQYSLVCGCPIMCVCLPCRVMSIPQPRIRDLTISRMGMFDDLYIHLPSQGWMFVPLSQVCFL